MHFIRAGAFYLLASSCQMVDSTFDWINRYSVDNTIGFPSAYPRNSNLSLAFLEGRGGGKEKKNAMEFIMSI